MVELDWYEKLRHEYRPERIRLLLVGESAPDSRGGDRRFFYSVTLSQHDNLYRGVSSALYGLDVEFDVSQKKGNLQRIKDDGVWLIDAVETPVNSQTKSARRKVIRAAIPNLIERCRELDPSVGVLICHTVVFEEAARQLREAGVAVLHDDALPFPLGNCGARFVDGVRLALSRAEWKRGGRSHLNRTTPCGK
ncbi:hypothetical protein [Paraburkholderia domus]|uniref:hypothetical protein n=1 Tax=Paraburkholderia domus TaxID=2793075 RepID=UPI0019138FC5|nr:hypothetical protein [Paraburkholderia domus]MBK5185194.1 hypothetical protein [Burkholderia sp. R-69749]CAE6882519.1 hypothetical protein R69749_07123 [Paraburkholderia domus]